MGDENKSTRSIQRWCPSDYYYHHGAGIEGARRGRPCRVETTTPHFLSYVLSFIYVGIYWNNHHHLFQAAKQVSGGILWANLNLLFWLSLFPFTTDWMGANGLAPTPTAVYGIVLIMAAIAYYIPER